MDKEEIPKCPKCGDPCKKRQKRNGYDYWHQITGSYYYSTCGKKECLKGKRFTQKRVGKKPKLPPAPCLAEIRIKMDHCWRCGGEKEDGRQVCDSCRKKSMSTSTRINLKYVRDYYKETKKTKYYKNIEKFKSRRKEFLQKVKNRLNNQLETSKERPE